MNEVTKMENSTITMFESFYIAAQDMDIESRVKFYEAIMTYGFYGEEPELPGMVNTVFTAIKPVIDRSRQMRESGRRGGRPRKNEENGKNPPLNHPFDGKERKGKDTATARKRRETCPSGEGEREG